MIERKEITAGPGEYADRFPSICRLKDGKLLLLWQRLEPTRFRWQKCSLRQAVSGDQGRTWQEKEDICSFEDIQSINAKQGVYLNDYTRFSHLPDGRLVFAGGVYEKETEKSFGGWWESSDEGQNWQGPIIFRDIAAPQMQLTRPLVLADGTIGILAVQTYKSPTTPKGSPEGRSCSLFLMTSADRGKSWQKRSLLFSGDYLPFYICEPDWVVFPDGRIRVFTRADAGYTPGLIFDSTDNGRTWKTSLMPFLGQHLAAGFIAGTEQVMVCFRACHYTWPPAVGAWRDDGSPYGRFLHIHQGVGYGRYMADVGEWVQLSEKKFMVVYSLRTEEKKEVRIWSSAFALDDFLPNQQIK